MRTRSLVISATLIAALVLALAVVALAQNPNIGTWKMNPAKSKFSYAPPKSFTATVETQGNGIKVVQDIVDASGKATHRSWTVNYDGKDYPITGDPDEDAVSYKRPTQTRQNMCLRRMGKRRVADERLSPRTERPKLTTVAERTQRDRLSPTPLSQRNSSPTLCGITLNLNKAILRSGLALDIIQIVFEHPRNSLPGGYVTCGN